MSLHPPADDGLQGIIALEHLGGRHWVLLVLCPGLDGYEGAAERARGPDYVSEIPQVHQGSTVLCRQARRWLSAHASRQPPFEGLHFPMRPSTCSAWHMNQATAEWLHKNSSLVWQTASQQYSTSEPGSMQAKRKLTGSAAYNGVRDAVDAVAHPILNLNIYNIHSEWNRLKCSGSRTRCHKNQAASIETHTGMLPRTRPEVAQVEVPGIIPAGELLGAPTGAVHAHVQG